MKDKEGGGSLSCAEELEGHVSLTHRAGLISFHADREVQDAHLVGWPYSLSL